MEFVGNIARKTGEPSLLAVEIAKTQKAAEIGKECGFFYVPKVVNFDAEAGIIEFEHLSGLITLFELAVRKDPRLFELLKKTGHALSVVHNHLILPPEMKNNLPSEWIGLERDNVFIHGDVTCTNVCLHEPTGRLVILDWSTAPLLENTATFGTRYFDILWFVRYLFLSMPGKCVLRWKAQEMADTFIDGYISTGVFSSLNLKMFRLYHSHMCSLYRKTIWKQTLHRPWYKGIVYFGMQLWTYSHWLLYQPKPLVNRHFD